MRHLLLLLALALATDSGPDSAGTLTRRQAREDLRYLHAALRELHPGLHRYSTAREVDEAFSRAEAGLTESISARDFFVAAASLSGVIRDGHTRFRLPAALEREAQTWRLLPLRVQVGRDRLQVMGTCGTRAPSALAGREIAAIDGVPAADVIARASALRSRDGSNQSYPRWALDRPLAFNEALAVLYGPLAEYRVTVASGGPPETVHVAAEPRDVVAACAAPGGPPAAGLRFLDDDRIAVLAVPTFVPDLSADYRDWFGTLARRGTRGLVIDLRDNGGGLDRNGSRLFAHLTRTPFRYYDAIVVNTLRPAAPFDAFAERLRPWRIEPDASGRLLFTGHECLGEQASASPAFDGPVVVLINGGTFSAASEFAAVAAAHRRARFVGEETGGAANGNTAGVSADLVLPHSGVRVDVPMMRYEVSAPGLERGRGVPPDVEVATTVADARAGRDTAGDQALALVRRLIQEGEKGAKVGAAPAVADLLARVSAEMGVTALEQAGFTQWTFTGTYDESVERGGFEPEPPAIVRDTFALDLRGPGAGWDSEGRRGDGSVRWRRFLYPSPDVLLRVEVPSRWAAATRSEAYRAEQRRAARPVPQALLREMASRPDALRLGPAQERRGESFQTLVYAAAPGEEIEVLLDARDRVRFVEMVRSVPFVGERRLSWEYDAWTRDRGVLIPRRLTICMGAEPLRVLALSSVAWSRAESVFVLPEGLPAPAERPGPATLPPAPLAPAARPVAEGVFLAPDVRPGIHAYFIRHADGVTAFEAPAGFLYPQIEIPPPDLARGRRSSEPGEALVDLIHRTLPGLPIRRVVITHAHPDHAGGVRAFAAAGAEIVVPRGAAEPVRRFLAEPFAREPDRWEALRATTRPVVREVAGRAAFGGGATRFEVLEVGENPHSAAMAVVWLPEPRLLLQGDLFYAEPLDEFPSPSRVTIMKWFAGWLERQGLDPALVSGTHSEVAATRAHFDKLKAAAP